MVPEYLKPIRYDASKLENLIGKLATTSYEEGIRKSLNWLRVRSDRSNNLIYSGIWQNHLRFKLLLICVPLKDTYYPVAPSNP